MGLPIVNNKAATDRDDAAALAGAQRLLDAGLADEARARLAPLVDAPHTAVRAHACLLYAGVSLMAGKPEDALAALDKLPARPPFAIDTGYRKMIEACALRQTRRYAEALAAAQVAADEGATPGRLLVLADAQKHAGLLDAAAATLSRLLDGEPDNATALAQLAGYRNLQGDLDAGAACFERFRACAAAGADARRNEAFFFATRGNLDATVAALRAALDEEAEATASYLVDEVEFDRFRGAPAFVALKDA